MYKILHYSYRLVNQSLHVARIFHHLLHYRYSRDRLKSLEASGVYPVLYGLLTKMVESFLVGRRQCVCIMVHYLPGHRSKVVSLRAPYLVQ